MPNKPRVGTRQITLRVEDALIERLERAVVAFKATHPGVKYDRADVIRSLLTTGLDALEMATPPPKRKRSP